MRFSAVAAAVWLSLSAVTEIYAATPTSQSAAAPAASPSNDAAARHTKRTVCLKEAKAKKLVGPDKASFLKNCISAP